MTSFSFVIKIVTQIVVNSNTADCATSYWMATQLTNQGHLFSDTVCPQKNIYIIFIDVYRNTPEKTCYSLITTFKLVPNTKPAQSTREVYTA